jgi:uncharacterized membrane protein
MVTRNGAPGRTKGNLESDLPVHGLPRAARAVWEVLAAASAGTVTGVVVALATPVSAAYGVLLAWDVAAVVYVTWVWCTSWRLDAEGTAAAAVREDPTREVSRAILLSAAVVSLVAVISTIADATNSRGIGEALRVLLGISSIVASWFLVHTLFTTAYAREYFAAEDGGIDFNMDRPPVWSDFAYLAFTIGMTFQVSDTDLQTSVLRRIALRHMLISYLFGAVIIAVTINLVAGLTK